MKEQKKTRRAKASLLSDANRKVSNGLRLSDKILATFLCQKIGEQIPQISNRGRLHPM